jgi:UPF0755 protein
MQGEQKKFVESLWPSRSRDLQLTSYEDVINLAAIVEKEASKADERPKVAAVYLNRLKKRMRLEADPTIIYGLTKGRGSLGRGLLKSEVEDADNPYNTYRVLGLPPTPIANPGRAAIEAVLKPAKTGDLFFVADGTGGHVFAESYSEHLQNVSRWRKIERSRADEEANKAAQGDDTKPVEYSEIPLPVRNPRR